MLLGVMARAEMPSVKLDTAALVSPSTAWTRYGSATTHTVGIAYTGKTPAELAELALALGYTRYAPATYAAHVFEYVHNNIAIEFRFGLGKGAYGALVDQSGTSFDQAALMVALLRLGGVTWPMAASPRPSMARAAAVRWRPAVRSLPS